MIQTRNTAPSAGGPCRKENRRRRKLPRGTRPIARNAEPCSKRTASVPSAAGTPPRRTRLPRRRRPSLSPPWKNRERMKQKTNKPGDRGPRPNGKTEVTACRITEDTQIAVPRLSPGRARPPQGPRAPRQQEDRRSPARRQGPREEALSPLPPGGRTRDSRQGGREALRRRGGPCARRTAPGEPNGRSACAA